MTEQLLDGTADLLERLLEKGPEPEFDEATEYELRAMGKEFKVHVYQEDEELKFQFLSGDVASLMKDASSVQIPWKVELISQNGNKVQSKIVAVSGYGMDSTGLWMKVRPE